MCSSEYNVDGYEMNDWNNASGDHGGDDGHAAEEEAAQGHQYFTATADDFLSQNPPPNSGGFDHYESHHQSAGVKRIKFLHTEEEIGSSEAYSSLGLRLSKTPSLINLVEQKLNGKCDSNTKGKKPNSKHAAAAEDNGSQPISDKLKAANFAAKHLRIGKWERESRHEGDLVAKCYYAKKKLVWEILEGALKSKIEIQWNDIAGIRATINDGQLGLLEIELSQPPTFHKEINPQPRKHTLWQQVDDFTGSEALKHRIHYVRIEAEELSKNYKRLLNFCPRLASLSRSPFPSLPTPFFEAFTRNLYQHSHEFLLEGYGNGNGTPYLPPPHPNYQFPSFPNPQISGGTMTNGMAHWVDNGTIQPFHNMNMPATHGMVSYRGMDSLNYMERDHTLNGNNEMMSFEENYENMVMLQRNLSLIHHQQQQVHHQQQEMADDAEHALASRTSTPRDGGYDLHESLQQNFQLSVNLQHDFPFSVSSQCNSRLSWDVDDAGTNMHVTVQPSTIYSSATAIHSYPFPYPWQTYDNNNPNM